MRLILFTLALATLLCLLLLWLFRSGHAGHRTKTGPTVIAFFHPHCSSGGGGERVLWKMIEVLGDLLDRGMLFQVVVYTVDASSATYKQDLLRQVEQRFSIHVSNNLPLSFVHLDEFRHYLAPSTRFSLLVESFGTMKLAYVALSRLNPHVFIDTTGCAFTYCVARLWFACPHVMAYVHYPTISTDMLRLVFERRRDAYNHSGDISSSLLRTVIKLFYYTLFALLYGVVGSLATIVMVNSTWTYNHIRSLWWYAAWRKRINIVFPPCHVTDLAKTSITEPRQQVVVSIGQFRPEKDHVLQLDAMVEFREQYPDCPCRLVMIGSCRGTDDEARLDYLRQQARERKLDDAVEFVVNQPYDVLKKWLRNGSVGIHTMWNEHFGIGVVEMMAAGMIMVAHNSGGPKSDIIVPCNGQVTGYLATTAEEYAAAIHKALKLTPEESIKVRQAAQASSARFSDQTFADEFRSVLLRTNILL